VLNFKEYIEIFKFILCVYHFTIKGKYLLTAWLDTGEENLDELLKNITERKINTPFEKIDPDKYYPVYW